MCHGKLIIIPVVTPKITDKNKRLRKETKLIWKKKGDK